MAVAGLPHAQHRPYGGVERWSRFDSGAANYAGWASTPREPGFSGCPGEANDAFAANDRRPSMTISLPGLLWGICRRSVHTRTRFHTHGRTERRILMDSHGHYTGVCADCGQTRPLYARRMCRTCYSRFVNDMNVGVCTVCSRIRRLVAKRMCYTCYSHARGYKKPRHEGECRNCGRHMRLEAKRLCRTCYSKQLGRWEQCSQCHERRLVYGPRSICPRCRLNNHRKQHRKDYAS